MNPTLWLTKASPHLRARALWAGLFTLAALALRVAGPSPAPRSAEGIAAMLGAAVGGDVRPDDFVWEPRGSAWSDTFLGRRVLFLARRAGEPADLYRAQVRLTRAGQALGLAALRNLSRSPLGDEHDLVALGHHAAYLTSAFGAVQGVTLLDLDGDGEARARTALGRAAAAVEGWLATGSTRGIARTEVTFATPPPEAREELQGDLLVLALGKEALPAALDVRDGTLDTGPSNVFAATAQRIPQRTPAPAEVALRAARALAGQEQARGLSQPVMMGETPKPPAQPVTMGETPKTAAQPATMGETPKTTAQPIEEAWPAPIAATVSPALEGEGAWTAGPLAPAGEAPPCFFETTLRPDPARPQVVVRLVAMDTRQIQVRLAAGVDEPRSEVGLHGTGRLPDEGAAERVIAAFAGGPASRPAGSEPGFVADRRVFVPPRAGLATIALTGDGRALLGPWGGAGEVPPAFASIRQTPDAILGWATPVLPLAGGSDDVERSALGLTRTGQLVYAWSAHAGADTLARALGLAGCTFAVPLAAGPAPVGFAYLGPPIQAAAAGMSLSPERLAGPSMNDLFYATLRGTGAPLPSAGGAGFVADGGRQPGPAWLPAIQTAAVVSLGAQVHLITFAPGRLSFRIRPGSKEPATKAVVALPGALPEGESQRVLAVVGLTAGRRHGARGLIVEGAVGLPFRGEDTGALVVEGGRPRVLRASEVSPSSPLDATELPLTADDGKLRPEARDVGTMRSRAAACTLEDGTLVVASTTFDSDEAGTAALLDLGCGRVVALDRGTHQAAFVHRAGTATAPEPRYELTALYAVEVPLSGRAGPLLP